VLKQKQKKVSVVTAESQGLATVLRLKVLGKKSFICGLLGETFSTPKNPNLQNSQKRDFS